MDREFVQQVDGMSIKSDPGFRLLAAQSIQKQLDAMAAEIKGVRRADDIENIHRMRVATRRLRAGLQGFEAVLKAKDRTNWRKTIRKTTKSLGDARDADVQIEFIESFLKSLDDDTARLNRAGIERLLLRITQRRKKLQPKVVSAMDELESSRVIPQMSAVMRSMNVEASLETKSVSTPACFREAARRILLSLETFLSFDPYVRDEANIEKLHDCRIAGKRLRYTLELFAPVYDDGLKPHIKHLKGVQDLLGELHDCDVWDEFLEQFVVAEEARHLKFVGSRRGFGRIRRGVTFLREARQKQRHEMFQEFVSKWDEALAQSFWDQLREFVQDRAIQSAQSRPLSISDSFDSSNAEETSAQESPAFKLE